MTKTVSHEDSTDWAHLPRPDLSRTALFLDVDGTLLDIAATPDAVVVPEGLVEDIARLCDRCGGAVAIVSGRPLAEIDRVFAPLILPAAAVHGALVRRTPAAPVTRLSPPIPAGLRAQFAALADRPGMFIEDKSVALALHYRLAGSVALSSSRVAQLRIATEAAGFALLSGKKVLEMKPVGTDKGRALCNLMSESPFAGRMPLFAGDDDTDRDAFAALAGFGGIGISVGRRFAGAEYAVAAPAQLRRWLHDLASPASG